MKRLFDNNISFKDSKLSLLREGMIKKNDAHKNYHATESASSTKGSPSQYVNGAPAWNSGRVDTVNAKFKARKLNKVFQSHTRSVSKSHHYSVLPTIDQYKHSSNVHLSAERHLQN